MAFDDLLLTLGELGRYQKGIFAICFLFWFPAAGNILSIVFMASESDHWCAVPPWTEANCSGVDTGSLDCAQYIKYLTIPSNTTEDGEVVYTQCAMYDMSLLTFEERVEIDQSENRSEYVFDVIPCDRGWVHDRERTEYSIVQEFDLVCDRKRLVGVSQSIFFVGVLLGSVIFGDLADRFGRKTVLLISNVFVVVFGVAAAFSQSFWSFAILRVFVASGAWGLYLTASVLGTEFVGPSKRAFVYVSLSIGFPVGYLMLTLYAYFIRNWRHLQLALNLTFAIYFIFFLLFPESIRWQLSKKRYKEAQKTIEKVARINKVKLPESFMDQVVEDSSHKSQADQGSEKRLNIARLFRTPVIRTRLIVLVLVWMTNNLVYYGLQLSTGSLGVNIYLSFLISGIVEIAADIVCIPVSNVFGRKIGLIGTYLISGFASFIVIFLTPGNAKTAIATIGKFGSSGSWSIGGLYVCEVFPTAIRNVGLGVCSMASRLIAIATPLILLLADQWTPAPLVIQTVVALVTAALCLIRTFCRSACQ